MNESTFTGKTGDAADSKSELVKNFQALFRFTTQGLQVQTLKAEW